MAKQTFTTGQVLSAAQLTSLQQTAMGGGAATAKTASYVLVAADAGTTVAMNAAGATTITVNTGLFAAGDTVFIQNLGAGACTVTAGTATVATAGSLILPQNDAGILYFTATGASIFYDFIQAGAVSPLTTKGDVYTFSTSDARLGVGANGTVLTADSAEATGLKWATASAADQNWSLVSTTATTSGTSVTITGLGTYKQLMIFFNRLSAASFSDQWYLQFNSSASANYNDFGLRAGGTTQFNGNRNVNGTELPIGGSADAADSMTGYLYVSGCQSTGFKFGNYTAGATTPVTNNISQIKGFIWANAATISSIKVAGYDSRTFDAGEIIIYGSTN